MYTPSNRLLAELFGLTSAEAALAADLLAGDELREIAARRAWAIIDAEVENYTKGTLKTGLLAPFVDPLAIQG